MIARNRALALLCLGFFVAGTLMASRPPARPRVLGRSSTPSITDARPKGRSRLDAIAVEETRAQAIIARRVTTPARPIQPRSKSSPQDPAPVDRPSLNRTTRVFDSTRSRLSVQLRC